MSAQEPIPDESIPDPYTSPTSERDPEKVDFPSHADTIPTFSAAFGSGDEVPPPNHMFAGRQRGPRFYRAPTEPFEQQQETHHNRSPSSESLSPERDVPHSWYSSQRGVSNVGSRSDTTVGRNNSQSSQSSSVLSDSKRWVIE